MYIYTTPDPLDGYSSMEDMKSDRGFVHDEIFAVKSAEISRSEFLRREQRIHSLINSPRIVGYFGCDVTNENGQLLYNLFIFIEYISGGTITDAIRHQSGRLHESEIRSHARSILQALDYLHSRVSCIVTLKSKCLGWRQGSQYCKLRLREMGLGTDSGDGDCQNSPVHGT
ncbi:hypothetical protein NE237_001212 [Protea cynaroides]|uniref:Protein kinase domain-containing protein n=1 Tax=Protea cynaroides TaxID=273540 RepID=A0A9Q0KSW2_9MAGN|nr:hypothetical protein NE237_001212 [Protea cynaroides]